MGECRLNIAVFPLTSKWSLGLMQPGCCCSIDCFLPWHTNPPQPPSTWRDDVQLVTSHYTPAHAHNHNHNHNHNAYAYKTS